MNSITVYFHRKYCKFVKTRSFWQQIMTTITWTWLKTKITKKLKTIIAMASFKFA